MAVRKLDDAVIDRIAAGEVVERPASVLKELVENAIDAGATRIDVELRGGGRERVRVVDDGCGMNRADATLCIERHATSKIRSDDDLLTVATLGFRGEAIPSIASVSRFELVTRPADEPVGTRIAIDHGRRLAIEDAGGPPGTAITVDGLFENVPARRKFLRADGTELAHCLEVVVRQVLIRPDLDVRVTHQGREILRASKARDLASRVGMLGDRGRGLLPVERNGDTVRVEGLIGPPGLHVSDAASGIYLFVNGRFVRDAILRRAVAEAYEGLLPRGRHPIAVLDVRIAAGEVDVNVHPAKTEVRFRDPVAVLRAVSLAIRGGLDRRPGAATPPSTDPSPSLWATPIAPPWAAAPTPTVPAHPDDDPRLRPAPAAVAETLDVTPIVVPIAQKASRIAPDVAPLDSAPDNAWVAIAPVGAVGDWLVCDAEGELAVVDRRLAEAAIARHGLERRRREGPLTGERLSPVIVGEVGAATAGQLAAIDGELRDLGVSVDRVGAGTVALTHLPLKVTDPAAALRDLAAATRTRGGRSVEDIVFAVIAAYAISDHSDGASLIAALAACGIPPTAPILGRWTREEVAARIART